MCMKICLTRHCILGISQPCITSLKYCCAPTKFLPQSDQQLIGWPLSNASRQNAMRNVLVLLSVTSSKWIALLVMQVNTIMCASFRVLHPTWKGPNMSNAVQLNAGNPAATRSLGSWPISYPMGFRRSFLHVTHLLVTCLAIFRTPTIQKHFLNSYMRLLNPQCACFAWRCLRSRSTIWCSFGKMIGFCISFGNDLMFSNLHMHVNNPCSSGFDISF